MALTDETTRLIAASKVDGTSVVNPKGEDLGKIDDIMIDKYSGQVAYAVLTYGSFLGMGGKRFPIPWDVLTYNTQYEAYVVNIPEDRLRNAPSYDEQQEPNWGDRAWTQSVHDYYGSRASWYR